MRAKGTLLIMSMLIAVCAANTHSDGVLQKLRRLVAGYHTNRHLMSDYGSTIGQLQSLVTELVAKSGELQQSASEAIELAVAKNQLKSSERLPEGEAEKLDQRQEWLETKIANMADSLTPKLQRVAESIRSAIDARLLLFEPNEHNSEAYRKLAQLISYTQSEYGPHMSHKASTALYQLREDFNAHRLEVKFGEPENDVTSGAQYDPDNTVFSRHPENLRHNAHMSAERRHLSDTDTEEEARVADDADKLKADFDRFGDELLSYLNKNASQMYFTGAPAKMRDSVAKELMGMVQELQGSVNRNKTAKKQMAERTSADI